MPRRKWTKERVLAQIRRLHSRGERLSARRVQSLGLGGMVATAYRLFGSWRDAIEQAGVHEPVSRARKWNRERIVAAIRGLARQGQDVSFAAVRRAEPRLVQAAYRHPELGNWGNALRAAGLGASSHGRRRSWSRQQIINEIQAMARAGSSLAFSHARRTNPKVVSAACSPRHFGAWGNAVAAAGFDYEEHRRRRRWTRERILATIRHLRAQGHPLSASELERAAWGALVAAARKPAMFGSWRHAVESAGIDYDQVRHASRNTTVRAAPADG